MKKIQDGVLEFLLINHPLDCPVCDRGGECPLQDQTLAFGPGESRFVEEKRHFEKPIPLSDLVLLDRERCIQCARCTRFADEIAGDPLIDFVDRGDRMQVLNFAEQPFDSYFSGNTVQICPVGALTASQYRFRARPWDLATVETSCTDVRGAVPRRVAVVVEPARAPARCRLRAGQPRLAVRQGSLRHRVGALRRSACSSRRCASGTRAREVSWPEALDAAAAILETGAVAARRRRDRACSAARAARNEDAYAWARLAKGVIGTDNVDAQLGDGLPGRGRARHAARRDRRLRPRGRDRGARSRPRRRAAGAPPARAPGRGRARRPARRLRGGRLARCRRATIDLHVAPGEAGVVAEQLVGAVASGADRADDDAVSRAAALLRDREGPVVVVLGRGSLAERADSAMRAAAALRRRCHRRAFLSALRRGNVHGALEPVSRRVSCPAGSRSTTGREWFTDGVGRAFPPTRGLDADGILHAAADGKIHVLVLLGGDPVADFPDATLARAALDGPATVIAVDAFLSESTRRADVVLPATLWGEKPGTVTNLEGRVQRARPQGRARRHRDGRLAHRGRARAAARRRLRSRAGRRGHRRDRAASRPRSRA